MTDSTASDDVNVLVRQTSPLELVMSGQGGRKEIVDRRKEEGGRTKEVRDRRKEEGGRTKEGRDRRK